MGKIVFGAVVYRQAICFLKDFLLCLRKQTVTDFELLLINDNLTDTDIVDLEKGLHKNGFNKRYNIVQGKDETGFLSDFRIQLLFEAKKRQFDLLIIGDVDDLFAENRIEMIYKYYSKYPKILFFYNDLISEKGDAVLKMLPCIVDDIAEISQGNFLGMSNTAINLNRISEEFIHSLYQGSCNIFDWYLYSRILLVGEKGIYVPNTNTIYRIYDNNLAGIQSDTIAQIEKEREIKQAHYQRLEPFSAIFTEYKKQLCNLVIDDFFYMSKYYNKNEKGYWWSNIYLEENNV